MTLEYNINSEILTTSIIHTVSNPSSHYIESVTIRVNSVTVNTSLYTSQPTSSSFTYIYNNISANIGDIIELIAICNIAGSITRSIEVTSGTTTTDDEPAIPGFFGIINVLLISAIILISFNYQKVRRKNYVS
jgi:hypothetical protein